MLDLKREIIRDFESVYRQSLKGSGLNLVIREKIEGETEEASADSDGKEMSITVSTAFLKNSRTVLTTASRNATWCVPPCVVYCPFT